MSDFDPTDLPNCPSLSRTEMIANALGASRVVMIEELLETYTVDSSHDPLPPAMIMAAFQRMMAETIDDADLLTEEDELTEDYDRTLENYFASSQFQADLFKMRWAI